LKTKRSFDGKLNQEYVYQKLSKSGNRFSSYSQKCRGCFLRHNVYDNAVAFGPRDFAANQISISLLSPQSDLRRRAASRWALLHISSC